jgi:hypothetical protein
VSQAQFDRVLRYIDVAGSEGARLLHGGSRPASPRLALDCPLGRRFWTQRNNYGHSGGKCKHNYGWNVTRFRRKPTQAIRRVGLKLREAELIELCPYLLLNLPV